MNVPSNPTLKVLTLRVPGDLISTNAEALRNEAGTLLEPVEGAARQWDVFKLDLSLAQMIDSVGLNLVVTLVKRVQKLGARMQITYSNPNILRTFNFTRLDKHVELVKV
jgi:anti-anti-sigma factor